MRKRVQIAIAILLVIVAGVIAWQAVRERQTGPVCRGRRLDYWLQQYAKQTPQLSEATNAFRQLGERAVPWLVQILNAPDSFGSWYQRAYDGNAHYLPQFLTAGLPEPRQMESRLAALDALALLAPSAHSAMPAIINALNDKDVDLRRSAAIILGQLGPITSNVVPALVSALTNGDWYTEQEALRVLGGMGPRATNAIPALVNELKHLHPDFRTWAAEGLGNMGPGAKSATTALMLTATQDHVLWVREAASSALLRIDPEAAAKAGIH
jgi:HEAT repeat protein